MIAGVVNLGRDNDARLLRLRTALALGTGFQLVLVEVEPGPIRKEVIRRIQTWSGHPAIGTLAVVSLDPDVTLAAQLQVNSGAIVTGLEPPSPTEAPVRDWIAELNWSRDALPGFVPGPLILVVSRAMHQALFDRASDFYSWRRHTARVAITARELALPLTSPGDRYWLEQRDRLSGLLAENVFTSIGRAAVLFGLADALSELGDEHGASCVLDEVAPLVSSLLNEKGEKGDNVVLSYYGLGRAGCALMRRDVVAAKVLLDEVAPASQLATLLRGRLHAIEGAWDVAVAELARAIEFARIASAPHVIALARECLAQVAFARGDIMHARQEVEALIEVASAHLGEWGAGMLLRLAEVIVDIYPDEIARLLDAAFVAVESSSRTATMIACLRAKRWWLLERVDRARVELGQAKRSIHLDDPAGVHASLFLCEAGVALAAGSTSGDEVAAPLARACELFRTTAPRQSAVAGGLLGMFWKNRGRFELAVAAYQAAAADARRAQDLVLAAEAELGELGAAVEGGGEQVDTPDRLRALAEQFRSAEDAQHEGVALADLGRCLVRRGFREAAVRELERARACFAATADAASELSIVRLLETALRTG